MRQKTTREKEIKSGIKQMQYMASYILSNKFDWDIERINGVGEKIAEMSDSVNSNVSTSWTYVNWAKENKLEVEFKENVGFMTPPMRQMTLERCGIKTTTLDFIVYALWSSYQLTYADLAKFKFHIEDLQDSIDRKFLSYEDIYKEQERIGFIAWK